MLSFSANRSLTHVDSQKNRHRHRHRRRHRHRHRHTGTDHRPFLLLAVFLSLSFGATWRDVSEEKRLAWILSLDASLASPS